MARSFFFELSLKDGLYCSRLNQKRVIEEKGENDPSEMEMA